MAKLKRKLTTAEKKEKAERRKNINGLFTSIKRFR